MLVVAAPVAVPVIGPIPVADAGPRRSTTIRRIIKESRLHGLWIAAWSVVGFVGTALAPALTDQPLALMMLSPRALFAALAANSVGLFTFVILGTARLGVTDASYFLIGRRLPEAFSSPTSRPAKSRWWSQKVRWSAQIGDRMCRWLCDRPALAASVMFLRPNGKILAAAGAYGVPARLAAAASVLGTATFLAALHLGIGLIF